jgi:uncharacterized protein YkwD
VNTDTILVIPKGARVSVLEAQKEWSRILYSNQEGWTANWLLDTAPSDPTELTFGMRGRYISNARVRTTGSSVGAIVTTLPLGTEVDILEEKNGWYRIRTSSGVVGFTASWLITRLPNVFPPAPKPEPPTPPHHAPVTLPATPIIFPQSSAIGVSIKQVGTIPTNIDIVALNTYWLEKVNALRRAKGLPELVLDQRWIDTASDYAGYMGTTGAMNHERADGKTMHQWIDSQGLPFTKRYSAGGWQDNYFSENISWGYGAGTMDGVKKVLDETMDMYLAEASYNGAHYRTTYHPDWNSVGVGFYFKDLGNGRYQIYCVFHYGSLVI